MSLSRGRILLGLMLLCLAGLATSYAVRRLPHSHHAPPRTASEFIERLGHIKRGMPYDDVVALIGKPRSATPDPATGNMSCEWYIGIKGEGDFFYVSFDAVDINQFIVVVFDNKNRAVSQTVREAVVPNY